MEAIRTVEYCTIADMEEMAEYERRFYYAYSTRPTNLWALKHLQIIDGDRAKPDLEYGDMAVTAMKINGRIVAGMKLVSNPEKFELTQMGFIIDKTTPGISEGINFFAIVDGFDFLDFFSRVKDFINHCMGKAQELGIKKVYSTCGAKILRMFVKMGFEIEDERVVGGEDYYLLSKRF